MNSASQIENDDQSQGSREGVRQYSFGVDNMMARDAYYSSAASGNDNVSVALNTNATSHQLTF